MKLFGNSKQSFSSHNPHHNPNNPIHNHNRREPITHINTNKITQTNNTQNTNFLSHIKHSPSQNQNISLFLRYRTESYLTNHDYSTALFYAERLLSHSDTLHNRLLVSKCYHSLTKYSRAYHVLNNSVRQTQTKYQRYLTNFYKNNPNKQPKPKPNTNTHTTNDQSLYDNNFDPLTPISNTNDDSTMNDIGFAFHTTLPNGNSSSNTSRMNSSDLFMQNSNATFVKTPSSNNTNNASLNLKMKENMSFTSGNSSMLQNSKMCSDNIISEFNHENIKILSEARYFISLICFELGRYDECEEFLLGKKWSDTRSIQLSVPNGVYGIYLLAQVFHRSSRFDLAIEYYNKCIALDSYHFGAIMALSELGNDPGLTDRSQTPNQCLLSKHCVIPIANENRVVSLEKEDRDSYESVKSLFDNLSWGYFKLQMFEANKSLEYFNALPKCHFNSAWVLNNSAKCYYEMNDYQRATCNWKKQIELYPYDMKGMDYYSTALWHLKKSKELTLLSQHCSEIDKTSYATWIVMGNCFSLHKSHDLAIKFFKKASVITNNNYAYAHTLAGHEYVVNEDFDNALQSFQTAIRINARHYNAWYGLGNIYQFQQNYNDALFHFNRAIQINPNSSVLYVCISNIYKLKLNYKMAIKYANKALELTDKNGNYNLKARLEKANIFILLSEYESAIDEFKQLISIIPNEWKIHFHLGEVYLQIDKKDLALLSFNKAMALNPKDKNTIKHAIQNVYNDRRKVKQSKRGNTAYQSILIEEEDTDTLEYGNNNHNRNGNGNRDRNRNRNTRMSQSRNESSDDDMLDDTDIDDDNDEFMNISRSNDISSVNVNIHNNTHSHSLSPQ